MRAETRGEAPPAVRGGRAAGGAAAAVDAAGAEGAVAAAATGADGAAWDAAGADVVPDAASNTSCLRMRPPTPVPRRPRRSTLCSAASLRTNGVTYAEPSP